jgi:hypothetical protein
MSNQREGAMKETDRDIRLQIMLQPEELQAIEDWRFSKRMPSRASAVRELIRRGLAGEGFKLAEPGKPSSAYGLTDKPAANARRGTGDGGDRA